MRSDIYGTIIIAVIILVPSLYVLFVFGKEEPYEEVIHAWNEDFCMQTPISNPGGLSFELAEVCYVPSQGWHENNAARLLDDDYRKLIQPLYMDVRQIARSYDQYNEDDNEYMYRRFIERGRDRYADR